MTSLLLAARPCGECVTTRRRIVSGARAAQLIIQCRENDVHFQCHKGSIAGLNLHCRGVHDRFPDRAFRFAQQFGIPVEEVDADALCAAVTDHKPARPKLSLRFGKDKP